MLKAYADEHVVFGLVRALRQRGMDVIRVQHRGRQQADDAELLDETLHDERVMLTNNVDFLVLVAQRAAQQRRFAPISFWPQQRRSIGQLVRSGQRAHSARYTDYASYRLRHSALCLKFLDATSWNSRCRQYPST